VPRVSSLKRITELLTREENEAFKTIGFTVGGMMVFWGTGSMATLSFEDIFPVKVLSGCILHWPS